MVFVCYISALSVTDSEGQALHGWRFSLLCILIPEYMYNISSLFRDRKWLMSSTAFEGGASVGWEGIPGRYGEAGKYINTG